VTGSGAIAPGPLFFANLSHGARIGAKSGFVFSIAHTLVEFTLVMLLAFGFFTVIDNIHLKTLIGVVGGVSLIVYSGLQIRSSIMSKNSAMEFTNKHVTFRNLFLIGLAFTGLNPFFVVWWFTAGAQLILIALEFMSFTGVILMYVCHVWMDYVWLITTAHLVKLGMDVSGFKWYRLIMLVFNVVLIFFGLRFIFNSIML